MASMSTVEDAAKGATGAVKTSAYSIITPF